MGCFLSPGSSVWAYSFCNESEIHCIKFRHPAKGIPAEKMFDPPSGGDRHCFQEFFFPPGRSDQADSFCIESEIPSIKFRHPTNGIPAEKMFDNLQGGQTDSKKMFGPPSGGAQTLFSEDFSALGGQIRMIPFSLSQKSLA